MVGYKLFLQRLEKLDSDDRKIVMENIFGVRILLYSFDEYDEEIVLKFYDGYTYYQINFIFDNNNKEGRLEMKVKERIVICTIFVNNIELEREEGLVIGDNLYHFLKMLKDGDISYFDSFL